MYFIHCYYYALHRNRNNIFVFENKHPFIILLIAGDLWELSGEIIYYV